MQTLVCPHCQSTVDQHASVCIRCNAEIVRGASRKEKATAGCLATLVGIIVSFITIGFVAPRFRSPNEMGVPLVAGLIAAALLFNFLGRGLASFLFRSRLRFFRNYQHR